MTKQIIIPHLWYDKEAKEAAEFYVSTFGENSKIQAVTTLDGTPSGSVEMVTFNIWGFTLMAISAGPYFTFNPSVSFHVKCKTKEEVDTIWKKLSAGGQVLMELGSYPFNERYGWVEDKYGLSWQILFAGEAYPEPRITPVLMFVGGVCGRAEEAIKFYTRVFRHTKTDFMVHYGKGEEPDKEGTVKYADFTLEGMKLGAMDSAQPHDFAFNEAISFIVHCDTQEEIDYYWEKLSAVPEAEQCGWLKDKFGFSWQVVPSMMDEMLGSGDKNKIARVTEAFLKMKKFDIARLQQAANEETAETAVVH